MFTHYFENHGWNIYEDDGAPIGCLDEAAVDLTDMEPDAFDPAVFPYEDSPGFHAGELFGADASTAH